jgi:hypothetical protein
VVDDYCVARMQLRFRRVYSGCNETESKFDNFISLLAGFHRCGTTQREISDGKYDLGGTRVRGCHLAINLRFH